MSEFPLYNSLIQNLSKRDLTVKQKEDFVSKVERIDKIGKELIYALICTHYSRCKRKDNGVILYNGDITPKSIKFDLSNFPVELRQILYKFIVMHVKSMDEEKFRAKQILEI